MSEVKQLIEEAREAASEQGWVNHSDTLLARLADALEESERRGDALESEVTNGVPGVGWFEWFMPGSRTTHVAHVGESGEVYDPENGWNPEAFHVASATGDAHRLVRLDAVLVAIEKGGESA